MAPNRIAGRVDASAGLDACWPWLGRRSVGGYGVLPHRRGEKAGYAHREMFRLAHGHLPPVVRHACDNPPCCNPLHLEGGDQAANVADMVARGRQARGPACPWASLAAGEVAAIRRRYRRRGRGVRGNGPALAREFRVSEATIYKVVKHQTYREEQT